ncbi:hypothetical protein MCAMS1_01115 [biofilm metagenome]
MKNLFLIVAILFATNANADLLIGRVVGVTDGDTIKVLTKDNQEVKVRLACIDAPEKKQAFGEKAKQSLAKLIYNKTVEIESGGTDRYKRTLGYIWLGNELINLKMVADGYAWNYRKYCTDARFDAAEQNAFGLGLGLWSDGVDPVPPWEYRHPKHANTSGT